MRIYLDNAATTPLDKEVFDAMTPYLLDHYGNPSSHHEQGRRARHAIEECRNTIAGLLNALPEEIIFTSGGTEADNTAILSAVHAAGIGHVITTRFEHHAVLHTLRDLQTKGLIKISFIDNDAHGNLDLQHLEQLLASNTRSLVSVMHANNEIGNLNDIEYIGQLCERYDALFHTDTVQTVGHYRHDLQKLKVHFLAASAHKFHGPKGVGFLYCRKGTPLIQLIHGGGQEKKLRAGTENIHGIVGLTTALQIAYAEIDEHQAYIQQLKDHFIKRLLNEVPEVSFNGNSAHADKSLYTVLNVGLPALEYSSLLRCLDEQGISVSGGSACSTGSSSHVLQAINTSAHKDNVRFSFSKFNTIAEIDSVITILSNIYQTLAA
ncbi:cysteine desulfurase [Mucilaginibacter daejeonensis]|uniref:cysteine desulfurase family protein n=1 Tax=Mucilaginibacter daejeonensis TaxID=398049 RepID=UPI001D1781F2|nr:cysteine desulfurase family protein [Mucilaginibacter daejeonensis]UEG55210.1 cysteine desulfurase [Mucilaginibacter daejeonensis]